MMRLSVVIPTHNRSQRLKQNLLAFSRQTAPSGSYEVIVVADGCTDNTAQMIESIKSELPCRLQLLEQPQSGAAQARNHGAAKASGSILLFLDDDMEPMPELVTAHIAAHEKDLWAFVLGRFWTPHNESENLFSRASRRWWENKFTHRAQPDYRFTFLDVLTGNISIPKDLFEQAGGFDSGMCENAAGEDYDIGIRLAQMGAVFRYAAEAASIHHDSPTLDRTLRRARQEGRGQTRLVQKYPELFGYFQISQMSRLGEVAVARPLWKLLWTNPSLGAPFAALLRWGIIAAEKLGRPGLAWRLHRPVHGYHYFVGVQSVLGSLGEWERLNQDALPEPLDIREIEVDLACDFERLDAIMEEKRPDAVRVSHQGTPILRIKPVVGAEPLRGIHVRKELLRRAPGVMLGILLERQLS